MQLDNAMLTYITPGRVEHVKEVCTGLEGAFMEIIKAADEKQALDSYFSSLIETARNAWLRSRIYCNSLALVILFQCTMPFQIEIMAGGMGGILLDFPKNGKAEPKDTTGVQLCGEMSRLYFITVLFGVLFATLARANHQVYNLSRPVDEMDSKRMRALGFLDVLVPAASTIAAFQMFKYLCNYVYLSCTLAGCG